ncbi:MAG: TldD/PmbA family protein [Asgard group archaeon]|nr:TldD/PmbA family protein [Asgard group archaeon]
MSQVQKDWENVYSLAEQTITKAMKEDSANDYEAYFSAYETIEVNIRNSEILTQNKLVDSGAGFRAIVNGHLGFSCSNKIDQRSFDDTLENAKNVAKMSRKDIDISFPESTKEAAINNLYDSQFESISLEKTVEIAKQAIDSAEDFDKRITVKTGRILLRAGYRGLMNSKGVNISEKGTYSIFYVGGGGQQANEVTGGCYEGSVSRKLKLEPEKMGEKLARKIVTMFGKKKVEEFKGSAIFASDSVAYQILGVLNEALNADNILTEKSAWINQLGNTVTSEDLTIIDNGILDGGYSSRHFDDEGSSSQKTVLVEKGKLTNYLHYMKSAKKMATQTTGNACRSPSSFDLVRSIIGVGYRAKPEIYPSNIIILPGQKTQEKLLAEIDKGVLIESMAGFPQKGSGMISAQLSRAYYVEKGEIQFCLKDAMVSGKIFDWLKQISGISKEVKEHQSAILPDLRIEDVKVFCG